MDKQTKDKVAHELFENTNITKEQYQALKGIIYDLDLDIPVPEESWDELTEKL